MTATSVLTTVSGNYTINRRPTFCNLRSSTTSSGDVWRGYGVWELTRGGSVIDQVAGPLSYAWNARNGDQIRCAYFNQDGEFGGVVSETITVADISTATYAQYVDTGGDNGNNGESTDTPVADIPTAVTNIQSLIGSTVNAGDEVVIYLKAAQTHSITTTMWNGGAQTTKLRIHIIKYDSGADPIVSMTGNAPGLNTGYNQSFGVQEVDFQGNYSTSTHAFQWFMQVDRSNASKQAHDSYIENSRITDWHTGILGDDDAMTTGTRDDGTNEFLILETVEFDLNNEYDVFGLNFMRYFVMRNVDHNGSYSSPIRVYNLSDSFLYKVTTDLGGNGSLRFLSDLGSGSITRRVDIVQCTSLGAGWNLSGLSFASTGGTGISWFEDISIIAFTGDDASIVFNKNQVSGTNDCNAQRVKIWNGQFNVGPAFASNTGAGGGFYDDIELINNSILGTSWAGDRTGFYLEGDDNNCADGAIRYLSNASYWPAAGAGSTRMVIQAAGLTRTQLAAKLSECDYNHQGKVDGQSMVWVTTSSGNDTLATWQGNNPTLDDASTSTGTTTFSFTNNGLAGTIDTQLSNDTSELSGAGRPATNWFDAAGNVRHATTPDAGAWEFGSSTHMTTLLVEAESEGIITTLNQLQIGIGI